tara:strand:- start:2247 stop:2768 length:522 start_codon:yes stop_codon:yes gene_type:complete
MNKYLILFLIILTIYNCESDDICPESTLTTPRLVVTFYDEENPEERKSVDNLGVYIVKNNELTLINEINGINTDSIAIPLRDDESVSNFKFCKDFSEDTPIIPSGLPDHVYFDYEINETFISRACGFINNYSLSVALPYDPIDIPGPTNWISEVIILNNSVTNENQSHVKIFH